MTSDKNVTRRSFLANAAGAAGSGLFATRWPAFIAAAGAACSRRETGQGYANLTEELGQALAAIAAQIIPSDEHSPGAGEAGVIWFMDAWLGGNGKGMLPGIVAGVGQLDEIAGGAGQFARLDFSQQTEVLKQVEAEGFFGAVRFLTIVGMFAMPSYGGNRDKLGWQLVGFKDQHAWQPPFGYYDALALAADGESQS